MAAGLVSHNITTATGVTFAVRSWVPDTAAPDVGAIPVHVSFDTGGSEVLTAAQVVLLLGYLDGVEGKLDSLHTDLGTTLAGYLDTVEAKLQTIADDIVAATVATATADVASNAAGLPVRQVPGETHVGAIGGHTIVQAASATITRPADTTAYASGDLVANSVTAGSVNNLQFTTAARVSGGSGLITGARIQKSTASVTNAAFRLHLFTVAPTYTSAGDNSAISTVVVASAKGYLGYVDITAMTGFSDVAWGTGAVDNSRGNAPFAAAAQILYGLLEARGAYTPGNAEVFTVSLMALQD